MCTIPFDVKINDETNYCLANDWEKGKYRYSLELSRIRTPKNTILTIGVNPGGETDPRKNTFGATVRRVCNLVIGKDGNDTMYDSVLFVNLTPVIAKSPSELKNNDRIKTHHTDNIKKIKSLIQERDGCIHDILFCFGNSFRYNKDLFSEVIAVITAALPSDRFGYWCLGLNKKGYPIHPLARMRDMKLTECALSQLSSCDCSFQLRTS